MARQEAAEKAAEAAAPYRSGRGHWRCKSEDSEVVEIANGIETAESHHITK